MKTTIIYYTSNAENEAFERKIMDNIQARCGNTPIISVSQKPIDFGQNICVGPQFKIDRNAWRQMLIGAKAAKTEYVTMAESDFLYPEDYFAFVPTVGGKCYRNDNVWVVYPEGSYRKKAYSEGAQVCDRELFISRFERFFEGRPEWADGPTSRRNEPLYRSGWEWFTSGPCISFKTGNGIRPKTHTQKRKSTCLPVWGEIDDLRTQYL